MRSHEDIAIHFRAAIRRRNIRRCELQERAGVSKGTLRGVLSGSRDFRVSTLLAIAEQLGQELVLVPRASAPALEAGPTTEPKVETVVARALRGRLERPK